MYLHIINYNRDLIVKKVESLSEFDVVLVVLSKKNNCLLLD